MKEIPLTQGKVAQVDDADFEWLNQWKWTLRTSRSGTDYAYRESYEADGAHTIYMHRLILGAPGGQEGDHVDGNGLNNCRHNLRLCTHLINAQNRHRHKAGAIGVREERGRWTAVLTANGITHRRYGFGSEADAQAAYNALAREYHPERPLPYPSLPIGAKRLPGRSRRKLTDMQVAEIRARYRPGVITLATLGREYGVDESMVSLLVREKRRILVCTESCKSA